MKLAWEITRLLYLQAGIRPVRWGCVAIASLAWIARRASQRWKLFCWYVGRLFCRTTWYRCETCKRLCHLDATFGSYTVEKRGDTCQFVGWCPTCKEK